MATDDELVCKEDVEDLYILQRDNRLVELILEHVTWINEAIVKIVDMLLKNILHLLFVFKSVPVSLLFLVVRQFLLRAVCSSAPLVTHV